MNLDDRLNSDSKRAQAKADASDGYYAEEPDWLIYKEREKMPWLNKDKGVFTETDKKSLNKRPSVFEATTVFDTGSGSDR
ncbi:MAG: hypothetical protein K6G42_02520 [Lachnospiraceae bacterium]|nr:hypothetical protein [Lachnospiraceae bacterium]